MHNQTIPWNLREWRAPEPVSNQLLLLKCYQNIISVFHPLNQKAQDYLFRWIFQSLCLQCEVFAYPQHLCQSCPALKDRSIASLTPQWLNECMNITGHILRYNNASGRPHTKKTGKFAQEPTHLVNYFIEVWSTHHKRHLFKVCNLLSFYRYVHSWNQHSNQDRGAPFYNKHFNKHWWMFLGVKNLSHQMK